MQEKKDPPIELLYNIFRHMVETSIANLMRNAGFLLASGKQDNSNILN